MNTGEYSKEKTRVQRFVKKWQKLLALNEWEITYEYEYEIPIETGQSWQKVAETSVDPNYLKAEIVFYLEGTKEASEDYLERIILHEIGHVFFSPIFYKSPEDIKDKEEAMMTKFARLMLQIHKKSK